MIAVIIIMILFMCKWEECVLGIKITQTQK